MKSHASLKAFALVTIAVSIATATLRAQGGLDLREIAGQPLRREPGYRALAGYLIFVVGDDANPKRVVVAVDRTGAGGEPSTAWVDRNGDGAFDAAERVFGAENRDTASDVLFELGTLDAKFENVRVTLSGEKKDEIKVTGRWDKKHSVWSEALYGESGAKSALQPVLPSAPVFRAGGDLKLEVAHSTRFAGGSLIPTTSVELHGYVGWAGVGDSTFLSLSTGVIAPAVDPVMKVRVARTEGPEKEEEVALVKRCLGNSFRGVFAVPATARPNALATITPSVPKADRSGGTPIKVKVGASPKKADDKKGENKDSPWKKPEDGEKKSENGVWK